MERSLAEARLASLRIEVVAEIVLARHAAVTRDGFVALVERTPEGEYTNIGSAGLVTGQGFATLLWRDGAGYFVTRGSERAATGAEIDTLRAFAADLELALGASGMSPLADSREGEA